MGYFIDKVEKDEKKQRKKENSDLLDFCFTGITSQREVVSARLLI